MSHGVHAVQHEVEHKLEHDEHGGGHGDDKQTLNKRVALLIAVIALFLAFSETLGKSAQTSALNLQIEASNLWNFFQAKTIRQTVLRTTAASRKIDADFAAAETPAKAAIAKQVDDWIKTAQRYESEEDPPEGRQQLIARAKHAEHERDTALARYHNYEIASAAFQIGIVLASATVITGMVALSYLAGGLGLIGLVFMAIGLLAPHAVHLM